MQTLNFMKMTQEQREKRIQAACELHEEMYAASREGMMCESHTEHLTTIPTEDYNGMLIALEALSRSAESIMDSAPHHFDWDDEKHIDRANEILKEYKPT